ncbi:MAG: heparinase II/III-family protein [Gemmatimonadota bacterium]|nr:heparinase II/III-family protein [Gemmatimonadota bacterium]
MSLLLAPGRWPGRRAAAAGPLAPLADSLTQELAPLLATDVYFPRDKALLSREGGRCAVDGSLLEFHPFNPHEHRCGVCGRVYRGELHDRFWLYWYQLWLAERAVHAALLYRLRGDARHATLARTILAGYAEHYLQYPNRDNVLGPGRVFFSTYIESIWLLQLSIALDLLEEERDDALGGAVRDRVIEPSSALIAIYNEGISNRQAWNNAALIAASVVLGRPEAAERIVTGTGGLVSHLSRALLPDGTWYEGENYHLFAHRGLWYCVTIAEHLGVPLRPDLVARFQEGFATPLLTALPDLTLVSRRDSQYAVSLRQVRFAELCELGLARSPDGRLIEMLHTLYSSDVPRGDTGRRRSTADVERNLPPTALSRADLGWRSLLHALPTMPDAARIGPRSVVLDAQGIAVLRRDGGQVYAALDFGHSGGGHGHPDRLNLLLADGAVRWLDDMGTGSYVDRTLFWYRSTLAHNAPLVDGRSQERVHGRLLAYEERGGAGWVDAAVDELAPGVRARRTVVVMPDYLLDEVSWSAPHDVSFELPMHVDGELGGATPWRDAPLTGGPTPEDGFEFVHHAQTSTVDAGRTAYLAARSGDKRLDVWLYSGHLAEWWRATAPGPPGAGERRFHLVRLRGPAGTLRSVWSWGGAVVDVAVDARRAHVSLADGTQHVHSRRDQGWHVDFLAGGARSCIDLGGLRDGQQPEPTPIGLYGDATTTAGTAPAGPVVLPHTFSLGERHYRRSEESWREAGSPTATVSVALYGTELRIDADVAKGAEPVFVAADAANRYDNEPPDINGDGLQVYLRTQQGSGAWVLVPEPRDSGVRVRPIAGWDDLPPPRASWRRTERGYAMQLAVHLGDSDAGGSAPIELDVIINETEPGRERRRGQLVMSGATGEFAYLAGDRHDPARLLPLLLES